MAQSPSAVQRSIRQRKPFRSPGHEAVVALLKIADLVHRKAGALVEPVGITQQQYNVLRILRGAGAEGLPTLEVAERMIEQAPGITRLLDRLEAKGLVSRERSSDDRRTVRCRISSQGLRVVSRLDEPMDAFNDRVLAAIPKRHQRQLVESLNQLLEGLD
ncbi:MAG TPA: MarR family transcriptional regulator [Gemmatimonadales bacterium]|nr:MarR family transcriptional regulator [Gemmatimonadales bacterium]